MGDNEWTCAHCGEVIAISSDYDRFLKTITWHLNNHLATPEEARRG